MTTIYQDSLNLLKKMYTTYLESGSYNISRKEYNTFSRERRRQLIRCIDYLSNHGYIQSYAPCAGFPISYTLTAEGVDKIEENESSVPPSQVFNIGTNNGIAGNNATGNTFNISYGSTFDDILKLISELSIPKDDKNILVENIHPLYDCMEKGEPIPPGILAKAKSQSHLEKYQTLYAAVLQSIVSFLTTVSK